MSACSYTVSPTADKVPGSTNRMSAGRDKVPADALSLSACTYAMYGGRNALSSGRDSVPDLRYKVSACFDQMSA